MDAGTEGTAKHTQPHPHPQFHRDPLAAGHVASAIPSLSVAMIRRGLGEIRGRWAQSTPENPMFICDGLCPKLQTDMSVQKFASLFVLGQHLKRHAKSNVQRAATALLKTGAGAGAGAGAGTGACAGAATTPAGSRVKGAAGAAKSPTHGEGGAGALGKTGVADERTVQLIPALASMSGAAGPMGSPGSPGSPEPPRPAKLVGLNSAGRGTTKPASKAQTTHRKPPNQTQHNQGHPQTHTATMSVSAEGVLTMRSSAQSTAPTTHYVLTRVNP